MTHPNSTLSYEEQKAKGSVESWRRRVFEVFAAFPTTGFTDREVIIKLGANDVNLVRPEITRLMDDRILREVGKTCCAYTGKTVRVCEWTGRSYFSRGNKKAVAHVDP